MKKGYFAISFADRGKHTKLIDHLVKHLVGKDIELLVFVDKYHFDDNQESKMMEIAFKEIDNSDFLIAELTHKSIGVGIEIGYAYATQKPIIYIRQKGSKYSTTTAGCAQAVIQYENEKELTKKVIIAINNIKSV
ncbi:MAG: nucleoside 2-deoxyribosyltransferase [Flavobacteriaceae bacterium]